MWRTINRICHGARVSDELSDDAFYDYFKCLNFPKENDYFIDDLENIAIDFLNEYDNCTQRDIDSSNDTIVDEILNNMITSEKVSLAISSLNKIDLPVLMVFLQNLLRRVSSLWMNRSQWFWITQ